MIDTLAQLLDRALKHNLQGVATDAETAALLNPARLEVLGEGELREVRLRNI
jgi:hypothetical protein